ncbi:hypothetical protein [Bradyrhizobium iriomotense]|uniref:hypothetical protein n=1 Tax=Bradyrhizobium iriomotense TaxID=441950 RepID=UPI001B8A0204|nr:hypothetical protein [Bradyrhizobium iriomotense]MBR1131319.1 hypothetical protein [Bradyrhizobium iriomotense]
MFLVIAGIVLLLPGLCTGVLFYSELKKPNATSDPFVIVVLGIPLVGAALAVLGVVIGIKSFARRR